jgi:hypothetical protein
LIVQCFRLFHTPDVNYNPAHPQNYQTYDKNGTVNYLH